MGEHHDARSCASRCSTVGSCAPRDLGRRRRGRGGTQSLAAFLRIVTHPRSFERPLSATVAFERVNDWLAALVAWVPEPGTEHRGILRHLIAAYDVAGNLVPDAMLAALAIEQGLTLYSADTDFARF
ncbi:MAG: PIN domain-containing protein, partial [Mycobacteriaceae bacterium]|nr:PIN domain-containing protein [Mycobacteriaceae bacterium]